MHMETKLTNELTGKKNERSKEGNDTFDISTSRFFSHSIVVCNHFTICIAERKIHHSEHKALLNEIFVYFP